MSAADLSQKPLDLVSLGQLYTFRYAVNASNSSDKGAGYYCFLASIAAAAHVTTTAITATVNRHFGDWLNDVLHLSQKSFEDKSEPLRQFLRLKQTYIQVKTVLEGQVCLLLCHSSFCVSHCVLQ